MKILFFGDIVGKAGRKAVAKVLPDLKKNLQPDITIANAENIAHGVGITRATLNELIAAGVDAFTSGNHVWRKEEGVTLLEEKEIALIRPHNMPPAPGSGMRMIPVGPYQLLLMNLQGQVFMEEGLNNPFLVADQMLSTPDAKSAHAIFIDFHGEATSEKSAFGWYVDGRASCVVGTHTHVATADARILTEGTGFISDVGMCGLRDTVIGVDKDVIVKRFVTGRSTHHEIPDTGAVTVNAVVVEIDPKTKKTRAISRVDQTVEIA